MLVQLLLMLALAGGSVEDARIRAQLTRVHAELRARDVAGLSPTQAVRRAAALAILERYIARGEFPRREHDGVVDRRPRFIDHRGVHCAVGYLIAMSGVPELARAINARYEYAYVPDIAEPRLLAWADDHGFTVAELARIQPTYGGTPPPTPDFMRRRLEERKDSLTLACAAKHPIASRVGLRVVGDKHGRVTATAKTGEPFERCFAAAITVRPDDDMIGEPRPFVFDITLELASPQQQLERRFAAYNLAEYCTPRPGAIPERVKLAISTSSDGGHVRVTTTPNNDEINACIAERAHRYLDLFARIPGLATVREAPLVSRLATDQFRSELQMIARSVALSCDPAHDPKAVFPLTVSAARDDAQFTIEPGTRDKRLAVCMRERLGGALRSHLAVVRMNAGKAERYFRIDTDVRTTVQIHMNR